MSDKKESTDEEKRIYEKNVKGNDKVEATILTNLTISTPSEDDPVCIEIWTDTIYIHFTIDGKTTLSWDLKELLTGQDGSEEEKNHGEPT